MHGKLNYSLSEFGEVFFALKVFIINFNLNEIHSNSSEESWNGIGNRVRKTLGTQGTSESSEIKMVTSTLQLFAVRAS